MSSSTSPSLPPIVALLIPQNAETWRVLKDLQASGAVLDRHKVSLRYQVPPAVNSTPLNIEEWDKSRDFALKNDEGAEDDACSSSSFKRRYGCIELDFSHANQKAPDWRVGIGGSTCFETNPRVDVLDLEYEQEHNMGIAKFHALISFHKYSGVLMLAGVSTASPIIYFLDNEPLQLSCGESHVLFQRSNRFRLGRLEFLLKYENMDAAAYASWISARNALLATHNLPEPCKHIIALPRQQNFDRIKDLIIHETVGAGRFGWVKAAVHQRSGNPCAIKQVDLKSSSEHKECENEVNTSFQLKGITGLLHMEDAFCEHGHRNSCRYQERFYLVYNLAPYGDFSTQNWSNRTDFPKIASLIRGPLRGIEALHTLGFIHRDISRDNILVQSLIVPDVVLADFGKAIKATSSTNIKIGPAYTLAPEVSGASYDNKIDIWSFGLAIFYTIFPSVPRERVQTFQQHRAIRDIVREYASRTAHHYLLGNLLMQLLSWSANQRPSATQALNHSFFTLCPGPY